MYCLFRYADIRREQIFYNLFIVFTFRSATMKYETECECRLTQAIQIYVLKSRFILAMAYIALQRNIIPERYHICRMLENQKGSYHISV